MSVIQLVSRLNERTDGRTDRQSEKQTVGHTVSRFSFLVSVKLGWTLGISQLPLDLCSLPFALSLCTVTAAQLFALMAAPTPVPDPPTGF